MVLTSEENEFNLSLIKRLKYQKLFNGVSLRIWNRIYNDAYLSVMMTWRFKEISLIGLFVSVAE